MIPLKDTDKARKTIGFCPQHNILISELNVDEHFKFFAQAGLWIAWKGFYIRIGLFHQPINKTYKKLKGFSLKEAEEELEKLVYEVQLGQRSTFTV